MFPDDSAPHGYAAATSPTREASPPEPMSRFARIVARWMLPGTLLACFWVTTGRTLISGGGWMVFLIAMYGTIPMFLLFVPGLGVAAQGMGRRPRFSLREVEAVAQATVWGGMFAIGLCVAEVGDAPGSSASVISRLTGAPADSDVFSAFVILGIICVGLGWFGQMCLLFQGRPAPRVSQRPQGYGPIG